MEKIYSKQPNKNQNKFEPKVDTINFLLNYSKSLRVLKYKHLKFDTILN